MNLKNITPVLKGNSSDKSQAYASSSATTGTAYPWKAFDNIANSAWSSLVNTKTAWIELLFETTPIVDYIEVNSTHANRLPKKILVYGSNDRTTYDLIHTTPILTTDSYPYLFKIPRTDKYKCLRLTFPESLNTSTSVYELFYQINEIKFYEDLDYLPVSERIKKAVMDTIQKNELVKHIITAEIIK